MIDSAFLAYLVLIVVAWNIVPGLLDVLFQYLESREPAKTWEGLDEDGYIDEERVKKEHLEYLKGLPTIEQWEADVKKANAKWQRKR